jgi:WD40 repeat protein
VLKLWETATGQCLASVQAHEKGRYGYTIWGIAFSPDGRIVATGAYQYDVRIRLWDTAAALKTIQDLVVSRQGGITAIGFTPDGRKLAAAVIPWPD